MLAKVNAGAVVGLDGVAVEVEVDVAGRGFPTFTIVGLPSKGIDEAKDRVRTAIANTSFEMPDSRITVNLAPADLPKDGSHFDLPIAVGILAAAGYIDKSILQDGLFIGELSLEGKMRRVPGVLAMVLLAREQQLKKIYVPVGNTTEASFIEGVTIYPLVTLSDLVLHLNGQKPIEPVCGGVLPVSQEKTSFFDYAHVQGQYQAKRVMEIAAAGGPCF